MDAGREFQALAKPAWNIPPIGKETKVDVCFRVTNPTDHELRLLSGAAIRFALNDEAGKPISGSYMRDATALCKPLDLKPSASADVSFQATLFYGTDRSSLCLRVLDPTGGNLTFAAVTGKHAIAFRYRTTRPIRSCLGRSPNRPMARQDMGLVPTVCGLPGSIAKPADGPAAPFWGGKAQTKNLAMQFVQPEKSK